MEELNSFNNNQNPAVYQSQEPSSSPTSKKNILVKLIILVFFCLIFGLSVFFIINFKQNTQVRQNSNSFIVPTQIIITPTIILSKPIQISFLRKGDIWLADGNGSNQKQLTKEASIENYYWIPKTNKLAFYRVANTPEKIQVDTKILNLENGEERIIHTKNFMNSNMGGIGPDLYFRMGVSSDSKKIAYGGDLVDKNLIVYDINVGVEKEVETQGILPIFSPDGQSLAGIDFEKGNLFIYSLNDNSSKQLINFMAPKNYSGDYRFYEYPKDLIEWSVDGKKLLYYFGDLGQGSFVYNGTYHINEIDIISKNSANLTKSGLGEIETYLDRSPDGRTIYYKVQRNKLVDSKGATADLSVSTLSGYIQSQGEYRTTTKETLEKVDTLNNKQTIIPLNQSTGDWLSLNNLKVSPDGNLLIYEWIVTVMVNDKSSTNSEIWEINTSGVDNHKIIDDATMPKFVN